MSLGHKQVEVEFAPRPLVPGPTDAGAYFADLIEGDLAAAQRPLEGVSTPAGNYSAGVDGHSKRRLFRPAVVVLP